MNVDMEPSRQQFENLPSPASHRKKDRLRERAVPLFRHHAASNGRREVVA
ncbi:MULTISPECIES: hypothetical protein [Burkholderia cepacia complex]|nr:hypothetical protein [Burkholderia cenocepacia]